MRVLAIDPGFERVGIAVLEGNGNTHQLLFSECFRTSPKTPFPKRLGAIGAELSRVIEDFEPEFFALETLFFNSNQKTAMQVAEARGMMLYLAAEYNIAIREHTPLQIKIAITGYGKAPKDQVATMTRALVPVPDSVTYDDEMDAIAVGLTCIASERIVA